MTDPRRLDAARRMIGAPRDAPATPALLLDLPRVDRNIAEMARRMDALPAALRPHAKVHKSPILARRQIAAGAIGITTANVWEASALLDDGIDGVLIANQVVGPVKAAELARGAGLGQVLVAVDDASNVDQLAAAARDAGTEIGVLVELDVGLHRAGVRGIEPAVELGAHVARQAGLRLAGLLGYEGHCMLEPDRALRISKAHASNDLLIAAADAFGRAGLCTDVVAAGGLGTWDITGANPRITEIHAGTYVFMDAFHARLVPGFEVALTVLGTVMSRSGDTAVLDCGRKAFGLDRGLPEIVGGVASVHFEHGEHSVHEEHLVLDLPEGSRLAVGDCIELAPSYAPTTVNLYDMYHVVDDSQVVDVWPILGRYGSQSAGVGPPAI
jgi:D-serine deaminase-like pyridoxal phosphate-dependent protein